MEKKYIISRYRLVWSRTSGSQPENPGSNPGGGTIFTLVNFNKVCYKELL